VAQGRIIAATETNRVVALDPDTGRVLWSASLGPPLRDVGSVVGCGNIDPVGITSTPVVDPATGTVFVVGEVSDGDGSVHHQLVGLDVATGAVRLSVVVDPPLPSGEKPLFLLQRASLALGNGRVYVPFGGHFGDCGTYHGWVVGADVTDSSRQVSFEVATDGEGGAIWQSGGAPALDAEGNLYVSTGNANPFPSGHGPDPRQYAESVVKLSPALRPLAAFKDPAATGDEDLSTGNPVLLPDGTLFAVGKTDVGFVLDQGDLTRVATIPGICGSDPDGGPAYDRATGRIFVPCRSGGIQVVELKNHTLGPLLTGADSAPIVVGTDVWALDSRRDTLTEFDAASGRIEQSVAVDADVPVFASPSTGLGLLLVGTTEGVTAFR
jgi:polyvinyl alcohol dehydrogenase (cytochrome)